MVGVATGCSLGGGLRRRVLVNDWRVGRAVLVDYGHHEGDELGPEVQVLYRRSLLLAGNVLFPALRERNHSVSRAQPGRSHLPPPGVRSSNPGTEIPRLAFVGGEEPNEAGGARSDNLSLTAPSVRLTSGEIAPTPPPPNHRLTVTPPSFRSRSDSGNRQEATPRTQQKISQNTGWSRYKGMI